MVMEVDIIIAVVAMSEVTSSVGGALKMRWSSSQCTSLPMECGLEGDSKCKYCWGVLHGHAIITMDMMPDD